MVERIQYSLSNFLEDWRDYTKSFEVSSESLISANKRERNAILGGCGVFITILFGLASIDTINNETLEFYLIIDSAIAIIVFTIYGVYNLKLTMMFRDIQSSFNSAIAYLDALRGSFGAISFEIDDTNESELRIIFYLVRITDGANKIRVQNELIKASKKKWLHKDIRNEYLRIVNEWVPNIEASSKIYDTFKEELNKEDWKNYQFLIQPIIDYKIRISSTER